ncbi:hypothetical protein [Tenacibaculum ovolyticum]|uniref:hypothetical protein n=1 Tax=Tenacibaculum ovolyticum TaxID=104270 RepID=UPI001F47CEEE|nr:hypothetical protein [Tenacibaculum ovolyticum]
MKFKSHVVELKVILLLIFISESGFIIGTETSLIKTNISSFYTILISSCLFIGIYCYYAIMNNDFTLDNEEILITNRLLFFKKNRFDKIKNIVFKDETIINIFSGYKWIKIEYMTASETLISKKIYCNGMEYDAFDENFFFPTFDEFFDELKRRGLNIEWTKK